jgi:hypothetical protein
MSRLEGTRKASSLLSARLLEFDRSERRHTMRIAINGTTIQFYLDKELSGQDLEDFRAHLKQCKPAGGAWRREAVRSTASITASVFRSDALRTHAGCRVVQFDHRPLAFQKTFRDSFTLPLQAVGRASPSWGALVATILHCYEPTARARFLRQANANSYIETAVAAPQLSERQSSLEIQSDRPVWLQHGSRGTAFRRLPRSVEEAKQQQVYRLTGGRLVNYKGGYAAQLLIRCNSRRSAF